MKDFILLTIAIVFAIVFIPITGYLWIIFLDELKNRRNKGGN